MIKLTKQATLDQQKQIKLLKQDIDSLSSQKETIKQQENIINQLTETIKRQVKVQTQLQNNKKVKNSADIRQLEIQAKALRFESQKMKQRLRYIQTVRIMNGGNTPIEEAQKIKQLEIKENQEEYDKLKKRSDDLMAELQRLVQFKQKYQEQDPLGAQMTGNEDIDNERIMYELQLKQKQTTIEQMQKVMMQSTTKYATQIANLKHQIIMMDAKLGNQVYGKDGFASFK